jgi:hypothetical protein
MSKKLSVGISETEKPSGSSLSIWRMLSMVMLALFACTASGASNWIAGKWIAMDRGGESIYGSLSIEANRISWHPSNGTCSTTFEVVKEAPGTKFKHPLGFDAWAEVGSEGDDLVTVLIKLAPKPCVLNPVMRLSNLTKSNPKRLHLNTYFDGDVTKYASSHSFFRMK